ncbi:hypothetical protein JKP88DRAFT_285734 [Tribonema minus]|uniref:Uncharacterized protein n=1 Tax=Tribonema minus TaxID=303371 RepID=A0A835Z271_9STRA|nr:hypothetical protein JKP88DRAFT_290891 [Tribonema minus]KAG5190713.1 hypothetical protein JKP88DRAFT_285734 [Tribonema minus]
MAVLLLVLLLLLVVLSVLLMLLPTLLVLLLRLLAWLVLNNSVKRANLQHVLSTNALQLRAPSSACEQHYSRVDMAILGANRRLHRGTRRPQTAATPEEIRQSPRLSPKP